MGVVLFLLAWFCLYQYGMWARSRTLAKRRMRIPLGGS